MKFKVGDIVRVSNPQYTQLKDGIGKIVCYRYEHADSPFPYRLRFLDSKHKEFNGTNENEFMIFNDSELEKFSDKEALAWMI